MRAIVSFGLGAAALLLASCGGSPSQTHNIRIDIGGVVVWDGDADVRLPGVTIAVVDFEGATRTATTSSAGLWTIENLSPGAYVETYTLAGYEPLTRFFDLAVPADNDLSNPFLARPVASLNEERMSATIAPFGVEVFTATTLTDGFEGVTAVYSTSAATAIIVTFSHPTNGAAVSMTDGITGESIAATPDAANMVWTFFSAEILAINANITPANPGLRNDQDPYTWHEISWGGFRYTPIHGTGQYEGGTLLFNATP